MQIKFNNVNFFLNYKTEIQSKILDGVNLDLTNKKFVALIGKTGSGKTTIIDLISGFLKPTTGFLQVGDFVSKSNDKKKLFELRKDIGVLFQFSEHQLFGKTVIDDVMFGIKNFYPKKNALKIAEETLELVGIDSSFYYKNPLELSDGEKKIIAIAGILAYNPKLLILDEITAGLDIKNKERIISLIRKIQKIKNVKVILATHDMDVVLKYSDYVVLLNKGKIIFQGEPESVFELKNAKKFGIIEPDILRFIKLLKKNGFEIKEHNFSLTKIIQEIKNGK